MNVRKLNDGRRILINFEFDGNVFIIIDMYVLNDVFVRCNFLKS